MVARILFAHERLVVVAKPAGVSLATSRRDPHRAVARLLAALPADERAGYGLVAESVQLVHRLDVGTSGVVVLARDEESHRDLVAAFAQRLVGKTYLALVWGCPRPRQGQWTAPLAPDRTDRRRMTVAAEGRPATTRYRVLHRARYVSLVALEPSTGRTHQLRVHLSHAGHPIVGDDLYGGPRHRGVKEATLRQALTLARPLLHAARLHLPRTPSTPELVVTAPLPEDFATTLAALGVPAAAWEGTDAADGGYNEERRYEHGHAHPHPPR
jgi:23S rRNA pseudouridine1911/1915/1917 synthase